MKRFLIAAVSIFLSGIFANVYCQEKGIRWSTGLSLDQVKEKAKKESKYIFLDLYATWCIPCKVMDSTVYVVDSVGMLMNDRFLSVRVQMDKTDKDNDAVKGWYDAAAGINKKYSIEGYPTFLFLDPNGEPVHKDMGAFPAGRFLQAARVALTATKIYVDPLAEYKKQLLDFDNGIVNQETLPSTIQTARRLNDTAHLLNLLKTHVDYVSALTPALRYTKENIIFWKRLSPGPATRIFGFFYNDGALIDKVMNCNGYAASVVDPSIVEAYIMPFLWEREKSIKAATSGKSITGEIAQANRDEVDWNALEQVLSSKYDKATVKRNLLNAHIEWYRRTHNYEALTHHEVVKLKTYPFDIHDGNSMLAVNGLVWNIFLNSTNKKELKVAIKWSKCMVDCLPKWSMCLDTHANLLYKVGRVGEGIAYEQKALEYRKGDPGFTKIIEQMRKGEPTYKDYGARW